MEKIVVWINNSSTYTTGCAGISVSAKIYSGCQYTYDVSMGMMASTTANITGVYDMSGGAFEYVSAYISNGNNLTQYGNSIINSIINKNIYNNIQNIYGDAIYEIGAVGVGAWNSDYLNMPNSSYPWFARGGNNGFTSGAGLFALTSTIGEGYGDFGFRVTVSQKQ